jgi:hypothetical protein
VFLILGLKQASSCTDLQVVDLTLWSQSLTCHGLRQSLSQLTGYKKQAGRDKKETQAGGHPAPYKQFASHYDRNGEHVESQPIEISSNQYHIRAQRT